MRDLDLLRNDPEDHGYTVVFLPIDDDRTVVVHELAAHVLDDPDEAARERRDLRELVGRLPVIQRHVSGDTIRFGGHESLRLYAADPRVDRLPRVHIAWEPPEHLEEAA